ncbi:hypothetical protein PBI_SCTP2_177 [Salicola phage SCTP-2]|nr:hypothetical protein PBI_SCTP2_177 [Salicola phage SCTP-2]
MYRWYIDKKIKKNITSNNIYKALEDIEKQISKRNSDGSKGTIGDEIKTAFSELKIPSYTYNDVDESNTNIQSNNSEEKHDDGETEEHSKDMLSKSKWMVVVEDYSNDMIHRRIGDITKYLRNVLEEQRITYSDIIEYFIYMCPVDKSNIFDEHDSFISTKILSNQEFLGKKNTLNPINHGNEHVLFDTYCNFVLGVLSEYYIKHNMSDPSQNVTKKKHVDLQKRIYFVQYYLMGLFDRVEYLRKCFEYERECIENDTQGNVFNFSKVQKEARLKELDEELLNIEFSKGTITYKEYLKNYHSIHGEKWVNFTLNPDSDYDNPDMVEIDVEYNDYFIEWLKSKDLEYDPSKFESYQNLDRNSEDYKDLLIEGWVKNTLMRTAASLLAEHQEDDQYGDTFQSVLASSPEGSLVENIEIDKDSYDNDDEFNNVLSYVKNRRMYK